MQSSESGQPKEFFKQFGLQRSGTNILKALIEINFTRCHVLTQFLGNKHTPKGWGEMTDLLIEEDETDYGISKEERQKISDLVESRSLRIIINIKEPIPWLESFHRYQSEKLIGRGKNPPEFDESWVRDKLIMWEEKVVSWCEFAKSNPENCLLVRLLQIINEPEAILNEIENNDLVNFILF